MMCDSCEAREAIGVDEHGQAECGPCATRWKLYLAAEAEVKARVIAALRHGRSLGLDANLLAWAVEDAKRVLAG